MALYAARRILLALPVLLVLSIGAFLLVRLVPGSPVTLMLGPRATPESIATLTAQLHLDAPWLDQYLAFLAAAVRLDLGDSILLRAPVGSLLLPRIAVSAALVTYGVCIALVIAIPMGAISGLRRNRPVDHSIRLLSTIAFGMPTFWLSLVLILLFSLTLKLLPTSGFATEPLAQLRALTLPALVIGLVLSPLLVRTLRSSVIETAASEHVEAARARGLPSQVVVRRHILRGSLLTMITVLGVNVGFLLSWSVVVETVFALPGLGSALVTAVLARDYPMITGITLVFGVVVVIISLVTDLLYAALDPRVRL
jgi:peptide/nickel transport system permease protein